MGGLAGFFFLFLPFLSVYNFCIYLKDGEGNTEMDLPAAMSLSKWPHQSDCARLKPGAGCQAPKHMSHCLLPPRVCTNRQLAPKHRWSYNRAGTLMSVVGIFSGSRLHSPVVPLSLAGFERRLVRPQGMEA